VQQPGVLIARKDGVIVVPNAIPVSRAFVAGLEYVLGSLDAPRPQPETRTDDGEQPPGVRG